VGNQGQPVTTYPAAYTNVVAVSATTQDEQLAPYSVSGSFIDLSAPGGLGDATVEHDIITTLPPFPDQGCPAPCYGVVAGTSFSSPYAAAVMALVRGANRSLAAADVVGVVQRTSIDLGAPGPD